MFIALALNDLRVAGDIVGGKKSILGQSSILAELHQERLISFDYRVLPFLAERTAEHTQELVKVNGAVAIRVKGREERRNILLGDAHAEVLAGLDELGQRESVRSIVVHDGEESLQADDASGATSLQLVSEQCQQVVWRIFAGSQIRSQLAGLLGNVRISRALVDLQLVLEEGRGELLVVELAIAVLVDHVEDVL